MTGPLPAEAKRMGYVPGLRFRTRRLSICRSFFGGKVPLPYSPAEGPEGLRKNVAFLKAHREAIGPGRAVSCC